MSDQELDELFKNASEKYDAPYAPNDWERLAARLDKETNRSGFWNWKTYLGLSTLLLVSIGSFIVFNNDDNKTASDFVKKSTKDSVVVAHADVKSEKSVKAIVSLPLTPSEETQRENNKNTLSKENQDAHNISTTKSFSKKEIVTTDGNQLNNSDVDEQQNRNSISERNHTEQSQFDNAVSNFTNGKTKSSTSNNNNQNIIKESLRNEKIVATSVNQLKNIDESEQQKKDLISGRNQTEQLQSSNSTNYSLNDKIKTSAPNKSDKMNEYLSAQREIVLADSKESKENENKNLVKENNDQPITNKANLLLTNVTITDSLAGIKKIDSVKSVADSAVIVDTTKVVTQDDGDEKKKEQIHHISLKLNISPDYSSIGYYSPDQSGFNFGLSGEYSFTSHWSVSSGVIWTKKIYSGNNIAYPHNGKMVNADQMNGNCRMIDWPINVNYYFTPTNRLGIYVSAGLSSYFMFNQNYNYEVNYGGSEYYRSEEINQKQSEWFKVSNVSFGLQYKLNQRWALQAEPFAKIPLAGVGQGNLKLVSSGIFFNIKYTFK